jgi:hypothetical protein
MTKAKWEIIEDTGVQNQDAAAALVEQIELVQRNLTAIRHSVNQNDGTVDIHNAAKLFNDADNSMKIVNALLCRFI